MPHAATVQSAPTARLEDLREEHRSLEERLMALGGHARLTPDEALEVRRLKKLKLRTKDAMFALSHAIA